MLYNLIILRKKLFYFYCDFTQKTLDAILKYEML